jgi:hypothetical protein
MSYDWVSVPHNIWWRLEPVMVGCIIGSFLSEDRAYEYAERNFPDIEFYAVPFCNVTGLFSQTGANQ